MKKQITKVLVAAGCIAFLTSFLCISTNAAQDIPVKIAPYYTEIDYMSVYNPAVEYPLITYKDITYFPMTYGLCTRLGLAVGFDADAGLYITKHDTMLYQDSAEGLFGPPASNSYDAVYTAVIPEYPVILNGIRIDNSKEEYPLLNFRNITYFPMTWRFAVEELGFRTEWSQQSGFRLYRNYNRPAAYFGASDKDGVNITVCTPIQEVVGKTESGAEIYQTKYMYERYRFLFEYEYAKRLGTSYTVEDGDWRKSEMPQKCEEIFFEDKKLRYMSTGLLDLTDTDAVSVSSFKYVFGNITFIVSTVNFGTAPAPYTTHNEYIFVKDNAGIRQLDGWDVKNNFSGIIPDGHGGYYLCSDSYSPTGASRWKNEYASVYRYTSDGAFREVTIPDVNSISAIGVYGTKLYIKAMYYGLDKSAVVNNGMPISAVNSGFYEYDTRTGSAVKLYAYIPGETFMSSDGKVYCLTSYGMKTRIINLKNGKITEL